MSFLPDWWSQGTTGQDSNGGFGTAAMFNQPIQRGDLTALVNALRNRFSATPNQQDLSQGTPQMNSLPSFTPYQTTPISPDFNVTQSAYGMSPNGSIMPNWNRR